MGVHKGRFGPNNDWEFLGMNLSYIVPSIKIHHYFSRKDLQRGAEGVKSWKMWTILEPKKKKKFTKFMCWLRCEVHRRNPILGKVGAIFDFSQFYGPLFSPLFIEPR